VLNEARNCWVSSGKLAPSSPGPALTIEHVNRARIRIVFPFRIFAVDGGLMSWGLDFVGVYRQAAT